MAGTARPLTTRDTVLLITHAAGNRVDGRTVMQKLAYFSGLGLGASLGHRAHFYGPYSSKVEDAVSNAVMAGELRETMERMADWRGGPDLRRYTYELTEHGERRVDSLIENNSNEWDRIRDSVDAIKNVLPSLDQKTLSSAAKTFLIISESSGGVAEDDIPSMAKQLGWELDPEQVHTTVDLLSRLDLLEQPDSDS